MSVINRNKQPKKTLKQYLKSPTVLYHVGLISIFIGGIIIALYIAGAGDGVNIENLASDAPTINIDKIGSDDGYSDDVSESEFKLLDVPPSNDYATIPAPIKNTIDEKSNILPINPN